MTAKTAGSSPWPYPGEDETWEEFADHQLDHDPTPVQSAITAGAGR